MKKMTHREYLVWESYLANRWDTPSRSDHYIMSLHALIESWMSGQVVDPRDKILKFTSSEEEEIELDQTDSPIQYDPKVYNSLDEEEKKEYAKKLGDARMAMFASIYSGKKPTEKSKTDGD